MRRKVYPQDVKQKALERIEGGEPVPTVSKQMGISESILYNWRAQKHGRIRKLKRKNGPVATVYAKPAKTPSATSVSAAELKAALLERDFWKKVALEGL